MELKEKEVWNERAFDLVVEGGKPLVGSIDVRGAKNVLPKLMVAALLSDGNSELKNLSLVRDVLIIQKIIRLMGGKCEINEEGSMGISGIGLRERAMELLSSFRNLSRIPILLAAPFLHRFGRAIIPPLGGCELNGKSGRAIDFHLKALREFGVVVDGLSNGLIRLSCKKLRGGEIRLDYPSVGATELVLLCASVASGTTTLLNASLEPEVMELMDVLKAMGGIITWRENRQMTIQGNPNLRAFRHDALPDRSEIGSWACAAAATNGSVLIRGAKSAGLEAFFDVFDRIGGDIEVSVTGIRFSANKTNLKPIQLETGPHPKFKTDWQPPLVAALTQANGESIIHETVFADRFGYVVALNSMGARIDLADACPHFGVCHFASAKNLHVARVFGASKLEPGTYSVADLRGGFSTLIGCLVANGRSNLLNSNWLSKGYDDIVGKLRALGVSVELKQP
jgi:UDP-N-acetylglucosamine 1-carboxyvinyltransferase